MKICIPIERDEGLASPVCTHFGRAPLFLVFDTESGSLQAVPNDGHHFGGTRTPAQVVSDLGVDVLLAGGLGSKAIRLFENAKITVFLGAEGTAGASIERHEAGALEPASPEGACKEAHGHH
jgi:predicted Fe-Mo cluster-binding NifX family protein